MKCILNRRCTWFDNPPHTLRALRCMYIAIVNAMYHTAAVVLMQSAEFAAIEVLNLLQDFFAGIHDERTVSGNRFVNRHTA